MKKSILIIASLALSLQVAVAQQSINTDTIELNQRIDSLSLTIRSMETDIKQLRSKVFRLSKNVDVLISNDDTLRQKTEKTDGDLDQLRSAREADLTKFNRRFDETDATVENNKASVESRTTWGIALLVLIIAIIAIVAFLIIKKIKSGSTSIEEVRKAQEALQSAQTKIQEESVKLDNKLLEIAEKQILAATVQPTSTEIDHSLTLKVADEIVRIEMNLSRMDASVKGYKQLSKAVGRIKDNFSANGYEIVDMLGKPYNEGMKVVANFVVDESLDEGKQIITGITKPQINYNGKMIQAAQITVSQNI